MNAFLDFINFEYTEDELIERIQDYLTYQAEAYKLLNEIGPNKAVKNIRPIRQQLDNEYSNYSRLEVLQVIKKDQNARKYYMWLRDVSTKTVGPLTSKNIDAFLGNMKNDAQIYFPDILK